LFTFFGGKSFFTLLERGRSDKLQPPPPKLERGEGGKIKKGVD